MMIEGDPNLNEAPIDEKDRYNKWILGPLEYFLLVKRNRRYRLYLVSHLCQHAGDWFIRIASLLTVERLAPDSGNALSVLVVVKIVPQVFLSHLGGALADKYDRRKIMLALDCIGAVAVLFFLVAIRFESLPIFYVVIGIRATIHSLYEPATKSIVPMIVPEPSSLKRAATINSLAWAFMLVMGGVIAGDSTAYIGVQVCFIIDSVTYFISAMVISSLKGDFAVVHRNDPTPSIGVFPVIEEGLNAELSDVRPPRSMYRLRFTCQPLVTFCQMLKELILYLHMSGFGGLVFLKASGSLIWGPADILNVSFSHVSGDEMETSKRLGYMFSCLGIGYALGPIATNVFTDATHPKTLQLVCVSSFIFMMIGWIGLSQAPTFNGILALTIVRAFGSGIIWLNSTLLLQMLSKPDLLGRVLALEFSLAMLVDAAVATVTGKLHDNGFTASQLSSGAGALSGLMFATWSIYHLFGRGAARKVFNEQ